MIGQAAAGDTSIVRQGFVSLFVHSEEEGSQLYNHDEGYSSRFLHFVLEMQMFVAHFLTCQSYVLVHDIAIISTHLRLFCAPELVHARRFYKDGL
jgi:hypothetical protein